MVDLIKAISVTIRTGKLTFGFNESMEALRTGKAKLLIISENCPVDKKEKVTSYAKILNIPCLSHQGSSYDLGAICGKKFSVSIAAVREPGDSEILNLVKNS